MRLGPARNNPQSTSDQGFGERIGIDQHLLLIRFEIGRQGLLKRHRLGRDHMHQRPALQAWKNRRVDRFFVLGLHQNNAAARPAQALMSR